MKTSTSTRAPRPSTAWSAPSSMRPSRGRPAPTPATGCGPVRRSTRLSVAAPPVRPGVRRPQQRQPPAQSLAVRSACTTPSSSSLASRWVRPCRSSTRPGPTIPATTSTVCVGGGGTVTGVTQFTYTADFGQGVTAAFSAQDQTAYSRRHLQPDRPRLRAASSAAPIGANDIGGTRAPDLVGHGSRRSGLGSVPGLGSGA